MLVRVLTMRVKAERVADWLVYTRDIGFPGMRAQPGCRGIWRLHKPDAGLAYQVHTNASEDHQEAVNAFREKRKPKFTGR